MNKPLLLFGIIGIATLSFTSAAEAAVSKPNQYLETYYYDQGEKIKNQSPLWTKEKKGTVLTGEQTIFIQQNDVLVALNPTNGTEKWRFSKGAIDYVEFIDQQLFIHQKSGNLSIVQAATGKLLSTINTGKIVVSGVGADKSHVYLITGEYPKKSIVAFDRKSGQKKWEYKRDESRYQSIEVRNNHLLVHTVESGAITQGYVYALDLQTGKALWAHSGVSGPIYETNEHYYFEYSGFMGYLEDDMFVINVVEKKTGKQVETYRYKDPNFISKNGRISYPAVDRAVVKENYLYLAKGPKLYQYDITKDPSSSSPYVYGNNIADDAYNGRYEFVLGPYDGKAFYISGERLEGTVLGKDFVKVNYEGISNPITTIDAFDNGLFVGMTDHQFVALNIETGKALFKSRMNEQIKGTKVVGNTIIVETEKQVNAFPLPKELSKLVNNNQPLLPGLKEADAKISINGKSYDLKTKPVFVENKMYLPFRELFELLQAKVDYNAQTKKITATTSKSTIVLTPNETKALLNNQEVTMEKMPFIHQNVTYVPLRAAATLLGAEVKWDTGKRTVFIEM
ncbi:stalk domain-containing protein [Peribacillus loiseleuriae]|uniref:stalk domain-containing protein n=1 Tax=Peribacillus loiseleuriae TaxID=1679170 RepID=UPI0038036B74